MERDKTVLLSIADGPEGFEFYTSEEDGIVDFAGDIPALYMTANVQGAFVKLGPFNCKEIRRKLEEFVMFAHHGELDG